MLAGGFQAWNGPFDCSHSPGYLFLAKTQAGRGGQHLPGQPVFLFQVLL
jgi:hypothetical protein